MRFCFKPAMRFFCLSLTALFFSPHSEAVQKKITRKAAKQTSPSRISAATLNEIKAHLELVFKRTAEANELSRLEALDSAHPADWDLCFKNSESLKEVLTLDACKSLFTRVLTVVSDGEKERSAMIANWKAERSRLLPEKFLKYSERPIFRKTNARTAADTLEVQTLNDLLIAADVQDGTLKNIYYMLYNCLPLHFKSVVSKSLQIVPESQYLSGDLSLGRFSAILRLRQDQLREIIAANAELFRSDPAAPDAIADF